MVLAEPEPLTGWTFVVPLLCQGIQHHADVPLVGTSGRLKLFQNAIDRLERIWDLMIQVFL